MSLRPRRAPSSRGSMSRKGSMSVISSLSDVNRVCQNCGRTDSPEFVSASFTPSTHSSALLTHILLSQMARWTERQQDPLQRLRSPMGEAAEASSRRQYVPFPFSLSSLF